MKWKPIVGGLVLIAALGAVAVSLGLWKRHALRAGADQPAFIPPEFVQVLPVQTESWQPTARLVGTVIAKRSVTLANEPAGVVSDVRFESGDTVEAGQVLLT